MLTFSEMLVLRRKELKLTQQELSDRTGISMVSLRAYEQGKRLPTSKNLNKIACALELDYDEAYNILEKQKNH